ncbi:hypothetical protein EST38_g6171 [Candolleomyces aberdarensis]|uniref:Uncharacterized protein n=1 Tax=Candolleomyces aberdarensis TaxID=2316362 RepID=A0A4Q2DKG4_9AGAR|nr:hypothetical protein EST38_g6171 [Candolleomyces aberdarensis]
MDKDSSRKHKRRGASSAPDINHINGHIGQGPTPVHIDHTHYGYYPPAALNQPTVSSVPGLGPDPSMPQIRRGLSPQPHPFASDSNVKRSLALSTDKAPAPTNPPGALSGMYLADAPSSSSFYTADAGSPHGAGGSSNPDIEMGISTFDMDVDSPQSPEGSSAEMGAGSDIDMLTPNDSPMLPALITLRDRTFPDGKLLATGTNRSAHIYDTRTGSRIHSLRTSQQGDVYVRSVCFSPCGKWLATGGEDRVVRIWDIAKQDSKRTLDGHQQEINSVKFSEDGRLLVSGSSDGTARVWDVGAVLLPKRSLFSFNRKKKSKAEPMVLAVFGSGADDDTKEMHAAGVINSPGHHEQDRGQSKAITSIAISSDGQYVAAGCLDSNIYIWDLGQTSSSSEQRQPPVQVGCVKGHEKSVYSVSFSKGGQLLVSASLDKSVKVWDMEGLRKSALEPRSNLPRSSRLPTVPGGTVSRDLKPRCVKEFVAHEDYILSAAVSHDGCLIASGGRDLSVRIWDLEDPASLNDNDSVVTERKAAYVLPEAHENTIISVDFSPSGNMLATASGDHTVKIWTLHRFQKATISPLSR